MAVNSDNERHEDHGGDGSIVRNCVTKSVNKSLNTQQPLLGWI